MDKPNISSHNVGSNSNPPNSNSCRLFLLDENCKVNDKKNAQFKSSILKMSKFNSFFDPCFLIYTQPSKKYIDFPGLCIYRDSHVHVVTLEANLRYRKHKIRSPFTLEKKLL